MVNISVGGKTVRALLDTGSAVSLCNSELLRYIKDETSRQRISNLDLRAANGDSLRIRDIRRAKVHLNGRYTPTEMIFVDHLQVPCILGMDFLNQAGILIDAGERKLIFRKNGNNVQNRSEQIKPNSFLINTDQDVSIQPMQELSLIHI